MQHGIRRAMRSSFDGAILGLVAGAVAGLAMSCGGERESGEGATMSAGAPPAQVVSLGGDRDALRERAKDVLGILPAEVPSADNPITDAKVKLGRMLYYDKRLSKDDDIACNSCHQLDRFGVDGEKTSPGHQGQRGVRNSPTVYNAALHIAQFWDGRAANVEEQAKGPILNPVEMAMPDEDYVLVVLNSIPGYAPLFAEAFPGEESPISYDNMARAIGAFERRLLTPSPFDAFLEGDEAALSEAQLAGLETFLNTGCTTCHQGAAVGGGMFQKLGLLKPYPTEDVGRFAVTGQEADRHVFKVPSLRNSAETAPYFHDGSIQSLDQAIHIMGEFQLGRQLADADVASIRAFLGSLTGRPDASYIAQPALPESGPDTPQPDPS